MIESVALPPEILLKLPSNRERFMEALIQMLDDDTIELIALADYGWEKEKHEAAIRMICRTGEVPYPLEWFPREVLALTRWIRPVDKQDHVMRAFACATLLHDPEHGVGGANQCVAPLIISALALGGGMPSLALEFLGWSLQATVDDGERPFYLFGILCLLIWLRRDDFLVAELACWIEHEVDRLEERNLESCSEQPGAWMLGLTPFDQYHDLWIFLTKRIVQSETFWPMPAAAPLRQRLATRILNVAPKSVHEKARRHEHEFILLSVSYKADSEQE